jgi:hypothetical protein
LKRDKEEVDAVTTTDPWAFCRLDLTDFGMNRLIDDHENRAQIMPGRTGGPGAIGREDFATVWIAHAVHSGVDVYLSVERRKRLLAP